MSEKVMKQKKRSVFPFYLLAYAVVLIGLVAFACSYVWDALEAYQRDHDAAEANAQPGVYMDTLVTQIDYEHILSDMQKYTQHPYVTESDRSLVQHAVYFAYLIADNGLRYEKNEQYQEGAPVYDLYAGEQRIAAVSLVHGAHSDDFGFREWQTKAIVYDTNRIDYQTYTVHVMDGMQVVADGVVLTEDQCVFSGTVQDMPAEKARQNVAEKAQSFGGTQPVYKTYRLEHLMAAPDLQVVDRDGVAVEMTGQTENAYFYHMDGKTLQMSEAATKRVLETCKTYINNIYRRAYFSQVANYLVYNSDAYKVIKDVQASIAWGWRPTTVEILSQEVSEIEMYSDDLFSCHYEATVYKADAQQEEEENFRYRMLFRKVNGQWYLTYFIIE